MTKSARNSASDPATDYALDVREGLVVAGPSIRAACERHLRDLETGAKRGLQWDPAAAQRVFEYFHQVLTVEVGGEVVPFDLLPFQQFVVGSIFGWKRRTGQRRFRRAYFEGGKGSGKSPLAAGIGCYMMTSDGELSAEVYAAGAKREQSMIIFEDVVKMVQRSKRLRRAVRELGNNIVYELRHKRSGSVFKPLARDKKKSGRRVSCALVDELHEHQDRYTVDMLQDGFKGRTQPLMLVTTNSGHDRESICYEWHTHALAVVQGLKDDDELFAYVCDLDPGDDPLEDEGCWAKTNPGLGATITWDYLRSQVLNARSIPGRENEIRRLNFCEWTDASEGWITRQSWTACEEELGFYRGGRLVEDQFGPTETDSGAQCFVALDLSFVHDLTAMALVFPDGDELLAWVEYFTPAESARERENKTGKAYPLWIKEGLVHPSPGKVIRMEHLAARLAEVQARYDVEWVAYDRYRHKELDRDLASLNVVLPMIEHPQGFRRAGLLRGVKDKHGNVVKGPDGKELENPLWMPGSVQQLESRIMEERIRIQPSAITRGQVSAVVVRQDPAGTANRIFDKAKATWHIDGIAALAMAVGAAEMRLPVRNLRGFLDKPVIAR